MKENIYREYVSRTKKHLSAVGSKNFDNLKKAKLAYHHFDERISQMWYDSKARQFPVSIDITMATQCNYDMSDLVSDKKGIYHVVPNIPYKKYSELVDRKEKEFFFKQMKYQ